MRCLTGLTPNHELGVDYHRNSLASRATHPPRPDHQHMTTLLDTELHSKAAVSRWGGSTAKSDLLDCGCNVMFPWLD